MKTNLKQKKLLILALFLGLQILIAYEVGAVELNTQTLDFSPVTNLTKKTLLSIVPLLIMIIGFYGTGRAAYKFMHGDPDATGALLAAVIGYGLALVANSIIR